MAETDIIRNRNESERNINENGFLDVRYWKEEDMKQQQLKKIAEFEYNTNYKDRKPFCTKCAINAVDKKISEIKTIIKNSLNRGKKENEIKITFDIDYSQFVGDKCFEHIDDTEVIENKLIDGIKQRVQTGVYKNFICKTCDYHSSMEFKLKETETTQLKIDQKNIRG